MNVLMISPGFPAEMPLFTRGLAEVGANVLGLGDQPVAAMDEDVRRALGDYLQVRELWKEEAVIGEVRKWLGGRNVDLVECLWEPGMLLAAKLREALGVPGMTVEETVPLRDKEIMKQKLDEAGIRTPKHARAVTAEQVREFTAAIGYPVIVKPIDGAGSADTYCLRSDEDLEDALKLIGHVEQVSVEEFIEGEEYTFDTVCANGEVLFHNVAWYRPKPLVARLNEWISPQALCLRDTDTPEIAIGRELGLSVLKALNIRSGFAHMEWFRTAQGEAVFGEIGGRPPGGRLVHVMNYAHDIDLFAGWAEAVCYGRLSQDTSKKYNACVIFKRSRGGGQKISRIEGLESLMGRFGEHVVNIDLAAVGAARRDWRKVIVGDGWVVVRHPDLDATVEISDRFSTDLRIHADA